MPVDIHDVITCVTLYDDRLRGLGVARGRISRFPIDLRRRPYNTLALPCECVIYEAFDLFILKAVSESRVTWASSVPILVFLGLSVVLDLGPMYATDKRQSDNRQTTDKSIA